MLSTRGCDEEKETFMKRLLAISLLSVTPALAGPFDQPYSIIDTDTMPSADSHLRPVILNRVDDENSQNNHSLVPPAVHKVTLDLPPRKGFRTATQQTHDLASQPCLPYHVAARREPP